jgi:hypothetical protein
VILLINRQHEGLTENKTYYNVSPIREEIFKAVLRDAE